MGNPVTHSALAESEEEGREVYLLESRRAEAKTLPPAIKSN
jgi:hypothetical protein